MKDESQLRGWTVGLNHRFALSDKWYASMRGGLYGWKGQAPSNGTVSDRSDLDKLSWYAAPAWATTWASTSASAPTTTVTTPKKFDVDLSTDMASVNAEYRF
ncbi:hypothetical protein [Xanthomonas arboricola]|uniref:hypothetical protein n=1 Tax=Xanthomonas arboricola TaxID=56448 RepID=UPI0026BABB49